MVPAMVVLDAMEKTAGVRVLQTELNDNPGVCMKLYGPWPISRWPRGQPRRRLHAMGTPVIAHVIPGPSPLREPPMKRSPISTSCSNNLPCNIRGKL